MAVYTPERLTGLLVPTPTTLDTVPASTKARYSKLEIANLGGATGRVWLWRMASGETLTAHTHDLRPYGEGSRFLIHSDRDERSIALAVPIPPRGMIDFAGHPLLEKASGFIHAMCDYADFGTANAAVLTTSEVIDAGAGVTYTATTLTDAGFTASPNNADHVGRRVEVGTVYGIVTSNTTTVLTMSDGWREKATGLVGATPANGTGYTVTATLRDTRETTLAQNRYAGHLITSGAAGARKTLRLAGNNAGIATYGTTFQGVAGGWSGGTNPGNSNAWEIDSLLRYLLDWVEEAA